MVVDTIMWRCNTTMTVHKRVNSRRYLRAGGNTATEVPLVLLLFWCMAILFPGLAVAFPQSTKIRRPTSCPLLVSPSLLLLSQQPSDKSSTSTTEVNRDDIKEDLLSVISATPSNAPTSRHQTQHILQAVRALESTCPTADDQVLSQLSGSWELLWTTQDTSNLDADVTKNLFRRWINPLENQAYSNNPNGRANPVLPRPIQDQLEAMGVIEKNAPPIRSTQTIDRKKGVVRNVVTFSVPSFDGKSRRATLTVNVDFRPNDQDPRRIDVKFRSCRAVVSNSPISIDIPLGIIGPTGWLRTSYIDDSMRITRGHKGSVFVLTRPQ